MVNKTAIVATAGGLLIFAVGSAAGYLVGKKRQAKINEKELNDLEAHYRKRVEQLEEKVSELNTGDADFETSEIPVDASKTASEGRDKKDTELSRRRDAGALKTDYTAYRGITKHYGDPGYDIYMAERESPPDDPPEEDPPDPQEEEEESEMPPIYELSEQEFLEDTPYYIKQTLDYYLFDDVLVDEHDQIVEDPRAVVGNITDRFTDNIEVLYVRNQNLAVDYEIAKIEGSYYKMMKDEFLS